MIIYVDRDPGRREAMARIGREAMTEIKCFECGLAASEFLQQHKGVLVIAASEIGGAHKLASILKDHTFILAGESKEAWWGERQCSGQLTFPLDRFEVEKILGRVKVKKAA